MKKNLDTRQEKGASPESRQAFKKFNELPQSKPVFFFSADIIVLLYCCAPRIAPLIVGDIDLNYLITE